MSLVATSRDGSRSTSVEVTPLSHRVLAMSAFRVVLLGCVILLTGWSDASSVDVFSWLSYVVMGCCAAAALQIRRRGVAVKAFGASLLLDAAFVQFWHERIGHSTSVDALVASLLVAVCLLASYRTGLKLAVWQSLLLILAWHSEDAGLVAKPSWLAGADRGQVAFLDMLLLWVVVFTTSVASSINERELRRRRHDAEALRGLALDLLGDHTESAVLDRLCGYLRDELLLGRVAVIQRDGPSSSAELRLIAGVGLTRAPMRMQGTSALLALTDRHGDSVMALTLDPGRDAYLDLLMPQATRVVAVPLRDGGRAITAVLEFTAASRGGRVERRVITSASQACATSALALARAELLEATQRDALVDSLTGVANRRSFDAGVAREVSRAQRDNVPVALVLADVDFFKKVNDVYGHQVGDQVLQAVGQVLNESATDDSLAARYGGEEFALILPGHSVEEAAAVAERIRHRIMEIEEPVHITMSFGIASVPGEAGDTANLILAADAALLAAKQNGRNQVMRADAALTAVVTQRAGNPEAT